MASPEEGSVEGQPEHHTTWLQGVDHDEIHKLVSQAQDPAMTEEDRRAVVGQIVHHTYDNVVSLANRYTKSIDDAQDVAQHTFERIWKGIHRFRGEAQFSTWLFAITRNTAHTFVERRNRRRRGEELGGFIVHHADMEVSHLGLDDISPTYQKNTTDQSIENDPVLNAEAAELRAKVEAALPELSDNLRQVIVLRDIYDMPYAEIGKLLGISESAAKVRSHRARKELKERVFPKRTIESRDL